MASISGAVNNLVKFPVGMASVSVGAIGVGYLYHKTFIDGEDRSFGGSDIVTVFLLTWLVFTATYKGPLGGGS